MPKFLNTPLAVIIIGVVVWIVAAGCLYEFFISPKLAELKAQTDIYEANKQYTDPLMMQQANQKVKDAQTQVAQAEAQWSYIDLHKNPDIELGNGFTSWQQLINELDFYLVPDLEKQLHTTGVHPLVNVSVAGPPNNPSEVNSFFGPGYMEIHVGAGGSGPAISVAAAPAPRAAAGGGGSVNYSFAGPGGAAPAGPPGGFGGGGGGGGGNGTIRVMGSFAAILHHVAMWNNFNRIAVITGLTLAGNSPDLTGSYDITLYEFPRDTGKPAAKPAAGGAPGPAGAAGAAAAPGATTDTGADRGRNVDTTPDGGRP